MLTKSFGLLKEKEKAINDFIDEINDDRKVSVVATDNDAINNILHRIDNEQQKSDSLRKSRRFTLRVHSDGGTSELGKKDNGREPTDAEHGGIGKGDRHSEREREGVDANFQVSNQSSSIQGHEAKQGTETTVERDNDEQRKADSGRVADDTAKSVEGNRNRGDIRVFEKGVGTHNGEYPNDSERNRRQAESERLVALAKQSGQFITPDETNN